MSKTLSEGAVAVKLLKLVLDSHVKIAAAQRGGLFALFSEDAEIWVRIERLRDLCSDVLASRPTSICSHCGGHGYTIPTFAIGLVDPPPQYPCQACGGTGRATVLAPTPTALRREPTGDR